MVITFPLHNLPHLWLSDKAERVRRQLQMESCLYLRSVAYQTEAAEVLKVRLGKEARDVTIPF